MLNSAASAGRWGRLLSRPEFWRCETAALLARLPMGMTGLLVVLVTTAHHGSYTVAGVLSACYGIGSGVGAPFRGRLVDRVGARWVLVVAGPGQAGALITFLIAAHVGWSVGGRAGVVVCAGLLSPSVGPIMRTVWRTVLDPELKDTAFALESMIIDVVYVLGPLLVSAAVALLDADAGLILAAVFLTAGSLLLAATPATAQLRGSADHSARDWRGAVRVPVIRALLPITLLSFGALSAIDLAAIATAKTHGAASLSGVLIAALAIGSIAGGVYWGSRPQPGTPRSQLMVLSAGMVAGLIVASIASDLIPTGIVLAITGIAVAPMITVQYAWVEHATPDRYMTEAFTWLSAASASGGAIANAISGYTIHRVGPSGAFLVAAAMTTLAILLTGLLTSQRPTKSPPDFPGNEEAI